MNSPMRYWNNQFDLYTVIFDSGMLENIAYNTIETISYDADNNILLIGAYYNTTLKRVIRVEMTSEIDWKVYISDADYLILSGEVAVPAVGKITEVTLNDSTWTLLPTTALVNRSGLNIQNDSGVEILINYDSTATITVGKSLLNGDERFYEASDAIGVYGASTSGNATVVIEETSG